MRITNSSLFPPVHNKPFVIGKQIEGYKIEKPLGWVGEDQELLKTEN